MYPRRYRLHCRYEATAKEQVRAAVECLEKEFDDFEHGDRLIEVDASWQAYNFNVIEIRAELLEEAFEKVYVIAKSSETIEQLKLLKEQMEDAAGVDYD